MQLTQIGDGPAVAEAMGFKTPGNAYSPCRACHIKGDQGQGGGNTYYIHHSNYDVNDLPMRENVREVIELISRAPSYNGIDNTREWGINRKSILCRLPSLHFPRSFPIDIMHCVLLNVVPNLWRIWNGTKLAVDKGMNNKEHADEHGLPSYLINDANQEDIGSALASARTGIPSYLGHAPRRIDNHYRSFRAAEWKAWLLLYGVPILNDRLKAPYVANFRELGRIYSIATAHTITERKRDVLARLASRFVQEYERLYYRGEDRRLPVCSINIHSILHLAQNIRDNGPACYWWQFTMERYCGIIKPYARSKSQLNTSLVNNCVINEHVNHLRFVVDDWAGEQVEPRLPRLLQEFMPRLIAPQRSRLNSALQDPNAGDRLIGYKRCQLRTDLFIGSLQSQRRSDLNRFDHRICYRPRPEDSIQFAEVQYFARLPDHGDWAWVRKLQDTRIDRELGITDFRGVRAHAWIRIKWILSLISVFCHGGVDLIITDAPLFE
jgi:Domain of unknown function (DUF4218)